MSVRNVLSIDGCGFRGRTQLLVLKELMVRHSGHPDRPSLPCEVFDLICGTAAGGLIAILLGRLGMTCDQAIDAYDDLESMIFDATGTQTANATDKQKIKAILVHVEPFSIDRFQKRLAEIIKDRTKSEKSLMNADDEHTKRCMTFVTVVTTASAFDSDAERIRSYSPPRQGGVIDAETSPGSSWTIEQAALATCSCQKLFSPFDLDGAQYMAANMSGFSNPSVIGYLEALALFGDGTKLTLISLGMGLRNQTEFGSISKDGIDLMLEGLGFDAKNGDDRHKRVRKLVSQTQLVATSTYIKHLRLDTLTRRMPEESYIRLDPPRNRDLFIFVDYAQKAAIEIIKDDFIVKSSDRLNEAVDSLQRVAAHTSRWLELRGYTCDSSSTFGTNPQVDVSKTKPRQIMRACYQWEAKQDPTLEHSYISCFAIKPGQKPEITVITGDFQPTSDDDSTLYVRILINDDWRFFAQHRALKGDWEENGNGDLAAKYPIGTILSFPLTTNPKIRAFRSDGWYSESDLTSNHVPLTAYDLSFSLPYHGTWVRTT